MSHQDVEMAAQRFEQLHSDMLASNDSVLDRAQLLSGIGRMWLDLGDLQSAVSAFSQIAESDAAIMALRSANQVAKKLQLEKKEKGKGKGKRREKDEGTIRTCGEMLFP